MPSTPFGAVQIVATMGGAAFATWTKKKGPALALLCVPPIIGCVMLLTITHTPNHRGPLLVAYYLISVYPGISEPFDLPIHWLGTDLPQLLSSIPGHPKIPPEKPKRRPQPPFFS